MLARRVGSARFASTTNARAPVRGLGSLGRHAPVGLPAGARRGKRAHRPEQHAGSHRLRRDREARRREARAQLRRVLGRDQGRVRLPQPDARREPRRRQQPVTVERAARRQRPHRALGGEGDARGHDGVGEKPRHAARLEERKQGGQVDICGFGPVEDLVGEQLPHHPYPDRTRRRRADPEVADRPGRHDHLEPAVPGPEQGPMTDDERRPSSAHGCHAQALPPDRVDGARDLERDDRVGGGRGPEHEAPDGPGRAEIQDEPVRLRRVEAPDRPCRAQVAVRRGRPHAGLADGMPGVAGQKPVAPGRHVDAFVQTPVAEPGRRRGRAERGEPGRQPSVALRTEDRHASRRVGGDRGRVVAVGHQLRDHGAVEQELQQEARAAIREERLRGPRAQVPDQGLAGGDLHASPRPLLGPERPQVLEVRPEMERQDEREHGARRHAGPPPERRDRRAEEHQERDVRRQEIAAPRVVVEHVEPREIQGREGGDQRQQEEPEAPRAARGPAAPERPHRRHARHGDRRHVQRAGGDQRRAPLRGHGPEVVRADGIREEVRHEVPGLLPRRVDADLQEPPGGAEVAGARVRPRQVEEPRRETADREPRAQQPPPAPPRQPRVLDQQAQQDRPQHHHRLGVRPPRQAPHEPQAPRAPAPGAPRRSPSAPPAPAAAGSPRTCSSRSAAPPPCCSTSAGTAAPPPAAASPAPPPRRRAAAPARTAPAGTAATTPPRSAAPAGPTARTRTAPAPCGRRSATP